MSNLLNAAAIWFIIGFVLLLLEFMVPGLILFFFAIGAWITAVTLMFSNIGVNHQLILFLTTSVISVLLFRKWVRRIISVKGHQSEVIQDEFIGKKAKAETSIVPGKKGKVAFKGTSWDATSEDIILPGEEVIITGNESISLFVKSSK